MLIIDNDPNLVVPNIVDRDALDKMFVAVIYGLEEHTTWIYFHQFNISEDLPYSCLPYSWYGVNCRYMSTFHTWPRVSSNTLLGLIYNIWMSHDGYETTVYRLDCRDDLIAFKNLLEARFSIVMALDTLDSLAHSLPFTDNFEVS